MNEYVIREKQIEQITENRLSKTEKMKKWNYKEQIGQLLTQRKMKYQNVEMNHKLNFDDMKQLIYDKQNPDDSVLFTDDWKLSPFTKNPQKIPQQVPPNANIKYNKTDETEIIYFYGHVEMEGQILARSDSINYILSHYNLRYNSLFLYPVEEVNKLQKQLCHIMLNERFDYKSDTPDYYFLKGQQSIKIKKDKQSQLLIEKIISKMLLFEFRQASCLRSEAPNWRLKELIEGKINVMPTCNLAKENNAQQLSKSKYYRSVVSSFIRLLELHFRNKKILSGELHYPEWLKHDFKILMNFQTRLHTNVIPQHEPLMSLKIKVQENQVGALKYALSSIFPFNKAYLKRSFIVYNSKLTDSKAKQLMNQLNYPIYCIGFPDNKLSFAGLELIIQNAGNLSHQIVDVSYNSHLSSISGSSIFKISNSNPSVKQIRMKGCYVMEGSEDVFFQGLSNSMSLKGLQIDFMDHYGVAMIKHLQSFNSQIY